MLGIEDKYVWLAYVLCLASTGLCVVYSIINWNRGDDSMRPQDADWTVHETRAEKELGPNP